MGYASKRRLHVIAAVVLALVLAATAVVPTATAGPNDVEGTVFRDLNFDGANGSEAGEPGIEVRATDSAGVTVSTVTGSDGTYALDVSSLGAPVRIQFVVPASMSHLRPGPMGADNLSDVRVVSPGATGVDFGVVNPAHFCQENPLVITNCYVQGDQSAGGAVMVRTEFEASGDVLDGGTPKTIVGDAANLGTTWGIDVQNFQDRDASNDVVWTAAFMKRFAGYGPGGPGAIYRIDQTGVVLGTVTIGAGVDPHDFTTLTSGDDIIDGASYGEVGKQSFGDLEISEDDSKLYVTNLFDRRLYEVDIDPTSGTYETVLRSWDLTSLSGATCAAQLRPGGIGVYDGEIYVGSTCDDATNAYVHTLDLGTGVSTLELTIPLGYTREFVGNNTGLRADWNPWTDLWVAEATGWPGESAHPQPWLSDIDFGPTGMVIGLRDRYSDQTGDATPASDHPATPGLFTTDAAGDVLWACKTSNGVYELEGSGSCITSNTGTAGPGGPEWFDGDIYLLDGGAPGHEEISLGGAFVHPGTGEIIITAYDALDDADALNGDGSFSQGLARLDPVTGDKVGSYRMVGPSAGFGKAAGLGDIEAFCLGGPVEIGNYVWLDTDGDGIQDPDETPLAGVTVTNTVTGDFVVTGADGYYSFTVDPFEAYNLTFDTSTVSVVNPATLALTTPNTVAASDDEVDSDATQTGGGLPTISGTAGAGSNNDHSLDVGFVLVDNRIGNLVWLDTDNDGAVDVGEPGISGLTVQLYSDDGDGTFDASTDTVVATTTTDSTGNYWFDDLVDANTYFVAIPEDQSANTVTAGGQTIEPSHLISSPGGNTDSNDTDNIDDGDGTSGFLSVSGEIDLIDGSEPTGETDANTTAGAEAYVEGQGARDLEDDRSNLTIDLGLVQTNRIGNKIWLDGTDGDVGFNDGIAQAAESGDGIGNVTVQLYADSTTDGTPGVYDAGVDALVDTTTTDVDGSYWFDGVPDGTYFVGVPTGQSSQTIDGSTVDLTDYVSSTADVSDADAGIDDRDDGDPAPGFAALTGAFDVATNANPTDEAGDFTDPTTDGQEADINTKGSFFLDQNSDLTIDLSFVETPKYSIGNLVWVDTNDNGVAESSEDGIEDVIVQLYDDEDNLIDSMTTNASGHYLFEDLLAGDYYVSIPAGQTGQTVATVTTDLQDLLPSANAVADPDAAGDADNDANGVEAVSGAINSGLLSLGDPDFLDPTEPTFETLRSDDLTDDDDGGSTADDQRNLTVDFGFVPPLRVGNLVWLDDGGEAGGSYTATDEDDGEADPGETGIEGVLVQLLDDAGVVIAETVTDANGNYWFDGLRADDYQVGIPASQTPELGAQPDIVADALDGIASSTGMSTSGELADDDDDGDASGVFASLSDTFTLNYGTEATNENGDFGDATGDAAETAANTGLSATTLDENSNLEIDFGFSPTPTYRLGNLVWVEIDDDGLAEDGEDGVQGILVQLLNSVGAVIAETVTDANGHYLFDELPAGDYQVRLPNDQAATLGGSDGTAGLFDDYVTAGTPQANADGNVDNDNNGVEDADGLTSGVVTLGGDPEPTGETQRSDEGTLDEDGALPDARSNLTVDFGLTPVYRVGNLVWEDYNNDGVADDGEPAITGVLVQLLNDVGAVIAETVTDANGHYEFSYLDAGDYQVRIPGAQTPELDPQPTIVADVLDGLRTSGTPESDADSGVDNDNNGVIDGVDFTSGSFTLGGGDGSSEPTGETLRDDDATLDENATFPDNRSNLTIDFGFYRGLRLGNQIFLDGEQGDGVTYNNGVFDAGEQGIAAVLVELWLDDGDGSFDPALDTQVDTDTTDAEGNYSFGNLDAGPTYFVAVEDIGTGSASSTRSAASLTADNDNDGGPLAGYDSVSHPVVLTTGGAALTETDTVPVADEASDVEANATGDDYPDNNSEMRVDLGFVKVPLYRIGNLVWEDVDNDGLAEDGENGIADVTVQLLDESGTLITSVDTDSSGKYFFDNLLPGDYRVAIAKTEADTGGPLVGMDSTNNNEEADPNDDVDNNDNGIDDTTRWVSGLVSVGDPLETNPSLFGTEPTTEQLRSDTATDDDANGGFYTDDRSNYSVDFGFLDIPKYAIGNQLWLDIDDDGIADDGEPGIGGVDLILLDDLGATIATQTTNADGTYLFDNLDAGEYRVVVAADQTGQTIDDGTSRAVDLEDLLPSAVEVADPDGDVDNDNNGIAQLDGSVRTGLISVGQPDRLNPDEPTGETNRDTTLDDDGGSTTDEQRNLTLDIGFTEPLRVGNLVWLDDGGESTAAYDAADEDDGVADATEPGIEGVLVQLLNDAGTVIAETVTDSNGNYWFDGLRAGDYQIAIPDNQTPDLVAPQPDIVAGALDGVVSSTGISSSGEFADDDDDGAPDEVDGYASVSASFNLAPAGEAVDEAGDFGGGVATEAEDAATAAGFAHVNANSNLEIDFGFSPTATYRLGNLVWEDYDNDGIAEDGEPGIEGVLVQLLNSDDDVVAETVTSASGHYTFTSLDAGNYRVLIPGDQTPDLADPQPDIIADVLDGLATSGTPQANANNETDNENNGVVASADFLSGAVTLGEGTGNEEPTAEQLRSDDATLDEDGALRDDRSDLTVDFGFYRGLRLGNQIFLDGEQGDGATYNNGVFDVGESGIGGVDVELWQDDGNGVFDPTADTLVGATTSDSEGNYSFGNLDAGVGYFVAVEEMASGSSSTGQSADAVAADNVDDGDPATGYQSVSNMVTLTVGGSSTGEVDTSPAADGAADTEADALGDDYPDGNSEMRVDLGFVNLPLYRIGNLVWEDLDNDGVAEDGEPGIEGVTVQLLDEDGDVIDTALTDVQGKYEFTNLMAGDYRVAITRDQADAGGPLVGKASSDNGEEADPNDDADNNDNGIIEATRWISGVVSVGDDTEGDPSGWDTEPSDEELRVDGVTTDDDENGGFYTDTRSNYSVDFGFLDVPTYEIGNLVWIDANDNGIADVGEPGIGDVELELYDVDDMLVTTVTTNADGSYLFTGLDAGDYQVVIPSGQTGQTVNESGGVPVDLQDLLVSAIHVADPDSPDDIDNDSNGVPASDGSIRAGFVSVGDDDAGDPDELNPNEPTNETDRSGGTDIDTDDDVDDARQNATVDFGFVEPLRVGNLVWLDDGDVAGTFEPLNQDNGVADSGEVGIAGVLVQLLNSSGTVIAETVTDANGNYWFDGLREATYQVGIPTDQSPALADPQPDIVVGATTGLASSLGMSGAVDSADDDDDGDPAPGYLTLSSTFALTFDSAAADEGGDFENTTAGAAESAANAAGSTHNDANSNLEVDLGLTPVPVYRLGNLVWEDTDNDGIAEDGEPGIGGVLVQLLDDDGAVIAETVTDSDGAYAFDDLEAGDYQVRLPASQEPQQGPQTGIVDGVLAGLHSSGTPEPDANNETDNDNNAIESADGFTTGVITLGENDTQDEPEGETTRADLADLDEDGALRDDRSDLTADFGLFRGLRLGNQIFLDGEQGEPGYNNGVFDAGESGISGAEVTLWQDDGDGIFDPASDTLVATTTSDSEGNYTFGNLDPDTPYFVAVEDIGVGSASEVVSDEPTDADNDNDGAPAAGYDSVSDVIVLTIGGASTNEVDEVPVADDPADIEADNTGDDYPDENSEMAIDMGFIDLPLYRIGNLVWNDSDNDGIAETGEDGLSGVTVQLFDGDGLLVAETTTAAFGSYEFPNLLAGEYIVSIPRDQAALAGYASSNQGEELAPDDDGDNNDNGLETSDSAWSSGTITIGPDPLVMPFGSEPTSETVRSDSGLDGDEDGGFYTDDRSNYSVDFGFYQLSLGSQVWLDVNGDGVLDSDEVGIDGVPVVLYRVDGDTLTPIDETVTAPIAGQAGSYLFTGLESGATYVVELPATAFEDDGPLEGLYSSPDPASGAVDADDDQTDGDDNGVDAPPRSAVQSLPVTLVVGDEPVGEPPHGTGVADSNENLGVDFGVTALSLGGTLWTDAEEDGQLDPTAETVLPGVPVELWATDPTTGAIIGSTPIATTTTDTEGTYFFDSLAPGDYVVRVPASAMAPEGVLAGLTSTVGNGVTPPDPDQDSSDNDDNAMLFVDGFVQTLPVTLDFGVEPNGEPETGPGGDGSDNHTVDLGFVPAPPMAIGNRVWEDTNRDGLQDDDEPGIAEVVLELIDAETGDVVTTTMTDDEGYFLFEDLTPGTYIVRIPESSLTGDGALAGYANSDAFEATDPDDDPTDKDDEGSPVGAAIESAPITLVPTFEVLEDNEVDLGPDAHGSSADRDSNLTVDFGFYPNGGDQRPAPEIISGAFWLDTNNDGIINGEEVPLAGVVLTVFGDAIGEPIANIVTDENGFWEAKDLPPGEYRLVVADSNFVEGGVLFGLIDGLAVTEIDLVIRAGDDPELAAFGNSLDVLLGYTLPPTEPASPDEPPFPLALTGSSRQYHQFLLSMSLIGLGMFSVAASHAIAAAGRRRKEGED